jgi:Tfp pilus assembly protein PilF
LHSIGKTCAFPSGWHYQYLQANNVERAIAVFRQNVKAHPDSWNVYDSLAEALERQGEKKSAIENYRKALAMVTDENQKQRISSVLVRLGAR